MMGLPSTDYLSYKAIIQRCKLAYGDPQSAAAGDYEWIEFIERDSSSAIFAKRHSNSGYTNIFEILIAGTNDIQDLSQAAMICGDRNRHRGFYLHSLRIKKAIEHRFMKHVSGNSRLNRVRVIGHSLGGVCAQYLSLDFAEFAGEVNVYSIGAPKGYRLPFKLPLRVHWSIYENDLDAIPEYPLTKPFDWGLMVRHNPDQIRRICLSRREVPRTRWQKFWHLAKPSFKSLSPRFTLDDTIRKYHSLDYYESFHA